MTHSLSSHSLYLCVHYVFKVYKCYMLKLLQRSYVPQSSRQIWEYGGEEGLTCRFCRESKMKPCTMVLYKDAIWLPIGGWENAKLGFAYLEYIFRTEIFFSKPNKLRVSIQSNNNQKYVTGEVKCTNGLNVHWRVRAQINNSQCPPNKLQGMAPKINTGRERKCPNNKRSG